MLGIPLMQEDFEEDEIAGEIVTPDEEIEKMDDAIKTKRGPGRPRKILTGKLTENSVCHVKSKHIDVRYHFIRDAVKKHPIKILYLPTEKMIADVLTKALPKKNHDRCILGLGLQSDNTSAVT
jgi:hypothetical protein